MYYSTRKLLLSFLGCVVLVFNASQLPVEADERSIHPRNPEGNYIVPGVLGDIVYRRVDGVELSMDAYLQKNGTSRPAVIVVHGGGWTSGSRICRVGQLLELLTRRGFNWFSIDYRLAPKYKYHQAVDDVRAALEFVRQNSVDFRIDKNRIALLGEDSGAHLATMVAMKSRLGIKAVVSLGGFYDLRTLDRFKGEGFADVFGAEKNGQNANVLEDASPLLQVNRQTPPTLIVHGTADNESPVSHAREFFHVMKRVGVESQLVLEEGAIHASENWRPDQWSYKKRVIDFLSKHLDLESADFTPYETRLRKNIVFGSYRDGNHRKKDLLLDAWRPKGDGPFPAVILAHGGGWEAGDKVTYLIPILEPLSNAGFAWFSIDYRLTPTHKHPDQLSDLRQAISFVRRNAEQFCIDADRIAILGESASGQMVVQVATELLVGREDHRDDVDARHHVQAVVSFYGVYDFFPMVKDAAPGSLVPRLFGLNKLDARARELLKKYSPIYHVHADMPPVLLIHGTNEMLWDQGVSLQKKLNSVGVANKLHAIQGAPHGMENWEGNAEWMAYKQVVVDWLKTQLKKKN